jgi:hypothetical protein
VDLSRTVRQPLSADQIADLETHLRRDDIEERVTKFVGRSIDRGVLPARSQSYDHCYNYFDDTKDPEADLEKSCAVLGFYLASWGMYRGSTYLQQETNSSHLAPAIRTIQTLRPTLAGIDLNNYSERNIDLVLSAYEEIKGALQIRQRSQVTIVTKVMVAAFGCIPAFDRNFSQAFRRALQPQARLPHGRVDSDVLRMLAAFYQANQDGIEKLHRESRTVAFGTDTVTGHRLSRAKIVDMYFYELGAN